MATFVAPRVVKAPALVHIASVPVPQVSTVSHPKPHHPVAVSHVRHVQPLHAKPVSVSFPLAFLGRDLLRLGPGEFRAVESPKRDGVLLLLAALAMGVLAVSSFALSRRLKGLA